MKLSIALILALSAVSAPSFGAVLTDAASLAGNQAYTGSLGLDFNVGSGPLWVTQLGTFDSDINGFGALTTIKVGLFERTTGTLVGSSLSFTGVDPGALDGAWRTKPLPSPIPLVAGGRYSVVAIGYNGSDPNYNTFGAGDASVNSASDRLTFVGARYGTGFSFPANADGTLPLRYGAGNFTLQSAPEPSSLMAFALAGIALRRRARR